MKIQDILHRYNITSTGFTAVAELGEYSNKKGIPATLSTLPSSTLAKQGIERYFAPRFDRGQTFATAEEIIEANIPVDVYEIVSYFPFKQLLRLMTEDRTIISSSHQGVVERLKLLYPNAPVYNNDKITKEDVESKHVIGTLPPVLVAHAELYTPVKIRDFDYAVDVDLSSDELKSRLVISDSFALKRLCVNEQ